MYLPVCTCLYVPLLTFICVFLQVYIAEIEADITACSKRNTHHRSIKDIEKVDMFVLVFKFIKIVNGIYLFSNMLLKESYFHNKFRSTHYWEESCLYTLLHIQYYCYFIVGNFVKLFTVCELFYPLYFCNLIKRSRSTGRRYY